MKFPGTIAPKTFGRWTPCTKIDQIFMYLEEDKDTQSTKTLKLLKGMWGKYINRIKEESLSVIEQI